MLAPGAEGVESPEVLHFVVAEDIEVAVVGADAEVAGAGGVPLVLDFGDLEGAAAQGEALRALIGAKAGVTLDANFAHFLPREKAMTIVYAKGNGRQGKSCRRIGLNTDEKEREGKDEEKKMNTDKKTQV